MYGLVFAGGGAKGAYQIGVWKALDELGIQVGLVVGTSVGALNGALYAQQDYELAKQFWTNMSMETVFEAEPEILEGLKEAFQGKIFQNDIAFYRKLSQYIKENKGLNIEPLRKKVFETLDEEKLLASNIDYGFITYNLNKRVPMKLYKNEIEIDDIKYYVLGSASVPGFARDNEFNVKLADGGIHDRFPIKMAINSGYKNIIAVETRQRKVKQYEGINITSIVPSEDTGNFLIFDKEQSLKNFDMGYLDALKKFEKLIGIDYYFTHVPSDHQIIRNVLRLSNKKFKKLFSDELKQEKMTLKRLFETEFPKLFRKLPIKRRETYSETVLALLEYLLKENKVPRLKIYNFYEAIDLCKVDYHAKSELKDIYDFLEILFI